MTAEKLALIFSPKAEAGCAVFASAYVARGFFHPLWREEASQQLRMRKVPGKRDAREPVVGDLHGKFVSGRL
jgi:hypothetical protein